MAEQVLMKEYKTLSREKWVNIELENENILRWNVALMILNPDSQYYGGYLKAKMTFPANYPFLPPTFKFNRPVYHPNIYTDGRLCISILHPPGDDETSGETAAERWSPIQGVESVLLSIISLLDDAECSSPANVDAGVMLRKDPAEYKRLVTKDVEASKKDIPEGFVMPTSDIAERQPEKQHDNDDFWIDTDDDDDFGGSDTDEVDVGEDEDEEMTEAEADDDEEEDSMDVEEGNTEK